jgi:hypothetical protein
MRIAICKDYRAMYVFESSRQDPSSTNACQNKPANPRHEKANTISLPKNAHRFWPRLDNDFCKRKGRLGVTVVLDWFNPSSKELAAVRLLKKILETPLNGWNGGYFRPKRKHEEEGNERLRCEDLDQRNVATLPKEHQVFTRLRVKSDFSEHDPAVPHRLDVYSTNVYVFTITHQFHRILDMRISMSAFRSYYSR